MGFSSLSIKLRTAIFVPLMVLIIASLVLLAFNGYYRTYHATIGLTESVLKQETKLLKQYVENNFNQADKAILTLSKMMQGLDVEANRDWIAHQFDQWNDGSRMPVVMLSSKGQLVRAESYPLKLVEYRDQAGKSLRKYSDSQSLLAETQTQTEVSKHWYELYDALQTETFTWTQDSKNLYLAYKVKAAQESEYNLIGTKLNKDMISYGLQKVIDQIEQADFYILNQAGKTLLKTPQAEALKDVELDTSAFDHHILIKENLELHHSTDWSLVLSVPSRYLVTPIERNLQGTLLQTLLLLSGLAFAIFILSFRAGSPMKKLNQNGQLLLKQRFNDIKPLTTFVAEYQQLDTIIQALKKQYAATKRYVPTSLIEKINQSENSLEVSGELKELSLMNLMIPNFTRLTEGFTADQVVKYLSAYHSVVYEAVTDKNGVLDHFEAENIQAYWGAPIKSDRDIFNSCHAAIEIKRQLTELNEKLLHDGLTQIPFYCGIYSGDAVVGNFGSAERMVYTAIGRSVEESKTLSAYNVQYGTQIVVCENTFQQVKEEFFARKLDVVYTSQHPEGLTLYELIAWRIDPLVEELASFVNDYETALDLRLNNHLDDAENLFMKLADENPKDEATAYQIGMVFQLKQQQNGL